MRDGKVQDCSATKWRTSEPLRMTPCSAASCPGSTEHRDFHDGAETTAAGQATNLEGKAEASLASREPGLMRQMRQMRLGVFYGLLWSSMVFYASDLQQLPNCWAWHSLANLRNGPYSLPQSCGSDGRPWTRSMPKRITCFANLWYIQHIQLSKT